jgi:hypothetical protein
MKLKDFFYATLLVFICGIITFYSIGYAFDRGIKNQDRMLCHSAEISGNEKWSERCKCFYEGKDISCIYVTRPLAE